MKVINRFLTNQNAQLTSLVILAVLASAQSYFGSQNTIAESTELYTKYNNYLIFKLSFFHLIEDKDLYILYLNEQWDLFKYSPTFALLFGLFAWLPDFVGLTLWNLLNGLVFFLGLYYLPKIDIRTKGLIFVFVVLELVGSVQNEQSNALMAGLLLFTFGFLERDKYWLAALCIVASIFIKLFGVVALALYFLYPNKWKLTYTTAVWVVVFTLLPLLVVGADQLLFLYKSWGNLLANDHDASHGMSVIGWLKTWFGWEPDKVVVAVVGAILFCLPLLKIKSYSKYPFRVLMLASVLLWVIIFNHRAESPTFIIAVSGVALWYFIQVPKTENLILLLLTLMFSILSPTDIVPAFVRTEWFEPYVVKAVPCILVWVKIIYDLLTGTFEPRISTEQIQD
ncbi:glycosyltransferase family 87 protein [Persicitalea sp.]|uniref:glycosyltransferase family 87 protein n=1 Tax=Persicitalea sp. TaxID=3100273 RepID=UPI0035932541